MEFFADNIASLQAHLARLTGLSLALYSREGEIVLPPINENGVLKAVTSSSIGGHEYADFMRKSVIRSGHRSDASIFKGPGDQYCFFIPFCFNGTIYVIAGGGVYLSVEDFDKFYVKKGPLYGFPSDEPSYWHPEIVVKDLSQLQYAARYICSIFSLVAEGAYERGVHEKRYKVMKIIMKLMSDMKMEEHAESVFDVLADIVMFMFNADSLSILIRNDRIFNPIRAAGRLKEYLKVTPLRTTGILSELVEKKSPFSTESAMEILQIGLSDEVVSLHAFPIISDGCIAGILNIINSPVTREDAEIILEICGIAGFVLRITRMQSTYQRHINDVDVLGMAAESITPVREPEKLYDAIVDTSVRLAEAERGSLMLIDDSDSCLTIKAAKGINRNLLGEIKIRVGEGVSGKVFREGVPLLMENIADDTRGYGERKGKYRTGSFLSIPLRIGAATIGVLNITDKITGDVFSEEDMLLLRSFASYASIALERSNYYSLAGHLRELSITDSLTGLFNRRYFEERFYEELHRSERHNLTFSLAMIDIDDFKLFNDTEGHLAGDDILKSIAYIAKEKLRIIDVIARFGGEEFAVIMPQTDRAEALQVAERIRNAVKEQIPKMWNAFPKEAITISIGIATYPIDGTDRKEIIRNADRALYRCKMEGKDRTALWQA